MDELVVVRDIGELIDLVLCDFEPFTRALVVADIGFEQFERFGCCFSHGLTPYDATRMRGCASVDARSGLRVARPWYSPGPRRAKRVCTRACESHLIEMEKK
jgi:hypothetical protein